MAVHIWACDAVRARARSRPLARAECACVRECVRVRVVSDGYTEGTDWSHRDVTAKSPGQIFQVVLMTRSSAVTLPLPSLSLSLPTLASGLSVSFLLLSFL